MTKKSEFSALRAKLDQAITYGIHAEAVEIAKDGLKEAQDSGLLGETEYFKGELLLLQENYASAIEHFDAAIKYNPSDGGSYNDRALCMVELGIIDQALVYFDKGIEVEPDYATIYHNKGWLLNNIGQHQEAIKYFQKALELEPERAVTYDNLADALFNLDDYQGAKEAYQKVLELLKPDSCPDIRREIESQIKAIEDKLVRDKKNISPKE